MRNTKEIKVDFQLKEMRNIKFNKDLFVPMKTKTIVDSILSTEGGIFLVMITQHLDLQLANYKIKII